MPWFGFSTQVLVTAEALWRQSEMIRLTCLLLVLKVFGLYVLFHGVCILVFQSLNCLKGDVVFLLEFRRVFYLLLGP